jgi:hypothetical protein
VGHLEFINQPLQCIRFLQRVQVFSLNVFDQGDCNGGTVVHVAHDDRYILQFCQLRSPPAAFTGDNLVISGTDRPYHYGLYHALGAD